MSVRSMKTPYILELFLTSLCAITITSWTHMAGKLREGSRLFATKGVKAANSPQRILVDIDRDNDDNVWEGEIHFQNGRAKIEKVWL